MVYEESAAPSPPNEVALARRTAYSRMSGILGQIAASILDPESLINEISNSIQLSFGYYLVEIWLYDSRREWLEVRARRGPGSEMAREEMQRIEALAPVSVIADSCRRNRLSLVNDVENDSRYLQSPSLKGRVGSELVLPMSIGGRVFGAINIEGEAKGAFSDEDSIAMQTIATQAAVALKNTELYEEELRRRHEAESLREASAALNESLDLETVLAKILKGLSKVIQFDSASILLMEGDHLVFAATQGVPEEPNAADCPPFETLPHIRKVLEGKEAVIIADAHVDPGWRHLPNNEYIRCWLGVPLISNGQAIGLLNLDNGQPGFYGKRDVQLAKSFAVQAAVAIENSRLYREEEARRKEAETLRDVAAAIGSSLDSQQTLDIILKELEKVLDYDSVSIMLKRGEKVEIAAARWHSEEFSFDLSGDYSVLPIVRRALESPDPLLVIDTALEPDWVNRHIRSWMGVPLRVKDQILGLLNVDHHKAGYFTDRDLKLAMSFANQAAIAIENARLYAQAQAEIAERKQAEALTKEANAEKLEFLSSLVAVIAHEVNTPAGVAITAASHLQSTINELHNGYLARTVGEKAFLHAIEDSEESIGILETNLERVADLVRNFRRIAVDQQLDEKRRFDVREYLDVVLLSLKPRLRSLPHKLVLSCPPGVEAETTPGALYQMVVNLIGNSLMHAFPEGRIGCMNIEIADREGVLEIVYSDDGVGIPKENLDSIFKPFFTTARANGGTGLGLYIVSNLAAKLGGTVACRSEPGAGVRFTIKLPGIIVKGEEDV